MGENCPLSATDFMRSLEREDAIWVLLELPILGEEGG